MVYKFSIIRFEPDYYRGDRVNIGLLIFREDPLSDGPKDWNIDMLLEPSYARIKALPRCEEMKEEDIKALIRDRVAKLDDIPIYTEIGEPAVDPKLARICLKPISLSEVRAVDSIEVDYEKEVETFMKRLVR